MAKKILLLFFVLLFVHSTVQAAKYDPKLEWEVIRTKNFKINYPKELAKIAQKSAHYLEDAHQKLSPELDWKPWAPTEVVLIDSTDEANGFASVLPYNWMVLYVTPPRADSALANYDDWLKLLITHEYTHILHLEAVGGFWRPFRLLLGKTISPVGSVPVWIKEGFATYKETKYSTGGRGRSTYAEMMVRTSVLENRFPKIDQIDGLQWEWPAYRGAYLYGVSFIQYLVDTYGEEKFLQFNKKVQASPLLVAMNRQAKKVYNQKTFYQLWREWKKHLEKKYQAEEKSLGKLTSFTPVLEQKRDESYSVPTLSPDGKQLAYVVESPHTFPQICVLNLSTGKETVLRKKQAAIQLAWAPDGSSLVYASLGRYKRYYRYFDLWQYDFKTAKAKRLTTGKRARDPAFHPNGKELVYIASSKGQDVLMRYSFDKKQSYKLKLPVSKPVQMFRPQWSPNGKVIALTMHRATQGWKGYLFTPKQRKLRRLSKQGGNEKGLLWSSNGKNIFFSSDLNGIANIYRTNIQSGRTSRLSNITSGLFHPATKDGKTFYAQRYHSRGFDVVKFTASKVFQTKPKSKRKLSHKYQEDKSEKIDYKPEKYVAFGKSLFLPRFVSPGFYFTGDTTIFTALTGAADPLRWHSWKLALNYRMDASHLGYMGSYSYNRFKPTLGAGVIDYVVNYGLLGFPQAGGGVRAVQYFEERKGMYTFLAYPYKRHVISGSYFFNDYTSKSSLSAFEQSFLRLGKYSGFRAMYAFGNPSKHPASISLEGGRRVRLLSSITDDKLGSGERNEQVIFAGDWREYIKLPRHHVIALRAGGGIAWGDRLTQGTFTLGGALGEGALSSGGSLFYLPLRGLPVSTLSRTRAMLLSTEYRFPLLSPQRGLGTTPFFVKNIHGAVFADYGNAWNADTIPDSLEFFDDFLLGVGAEIRGDFVIAHGLPLVGRIGYAIIVLNRDRLGTLQDDVLGSSIKNGAFILQIGTSF